MKLEIKSFRTQVARRIFTLFIICSILPITALSIVSYAHVKSQLNAQSRQRLKQESTALAVSLYERLILIRSDMYLLASVFQMGMANLSEARSHTVTENLKTRFNRLTVVADGSTVPLIGKGNIPLNLTPEQEAHIHSNKTLLTKGNGDDASQSLLMCVVLDPDEPERGMLIGEINNRFLWDAAERIPAMTELSILDDKNDILFSTFENLTSFPSPYFDAMKQSHGGLFDWERDGKLFLACYTTLFLEPNFLYPKWIVVLAESREHILSPMVYFKLTFLIVLIFSLGLVFFLSMGLIRKNMGPIETLREATNAIAAGKVGHTVDIKSGDEFEKLGQSFNEMSRKLEEGQALLVRSAKLAAMGQMAAGIVHEIKQPVSAMYGLLQYMVDVEASEEQKEYFETIMGSMERLKGIVSRFGSFSYMYEEAMQGVSLSHVVDQVYQLIAHQFDMQGIDCRIDNAENLPMIIGDPNGLQQVLSNLLINAMHALESNETGNRRVQISTRASNGGVIVEIADNGCGIPEEFRERIFDPFFTTKGPERGSGLGMSIVESILHKHQANIHVESEVGKGTKISMNFPVRTE